MVRRAAISVGLAGLTLLAACSDIKTPTEPATSAAFDMGGNGNGDVNGEGAEHRHVFELRNSAGGNHAAKPGSGTGISYHGGPVLQAGTKVVAIYWSATPIYTNGPATGSGPGANDASNVGIFLRGLGGSPYFNINTTYTDKTGKPIANSVQYTSYWANATSAPTGSQVVTDAQMASMLASGFNSGALTYDASTLYVIFTAGTVNLGGGFGTQYCGYHTHATINGKLVLYAALPYDNAYPGVCTEGTAAPNGDAGADNEVSVLAHEIEETSTDMLGTAWFDNQGYENADKCAWTFGTTYTTGFGGVANMNVGGKDFLVQRNWVNSGKGGCLLSW